MAFSFGGNGNGSSFGRSRFRGSGGTLSEMNVVPLVDVVLVLLIIFMLTAHVMEYGLEVNVPKVTHTKDTSETNLPIVTLTKDGEIMLGEKPCNINELGTSIQAKYPRATSVFLRADKDTVFDGLAQVVDQLANSNLAVKLVTQPADAPARRSR